MPISEQAYKTLILNLSSATLSRLDQYYPERTITINSSDPHHPPYTTPEIKQMLRLRNSLMRRNKIEKVSFFSLKINRAISKVI